MVCEISEDPCEIAQHIIEHPGHWPMVRDKTEDGRIPSEFRIFRQVVWQYYLIQNVPPMS